MSTLEKSFWFYNDFLAMFYNIGFYDVGSSVQIYEEKLDVVAK